MVALQERALKPGLGVEILNLDIRQADDEVASAIADSFQKNGVVVLRDQKLRPDELSAFAAKFGELERNKLLQYTIPDHPEIYILSNKKVDGKPIGAHLDGITWHTDGTYLEYPPMLTLLYALEAPPEGGETLVADASAAFYALPLERQEELAAMKALHSYVWFQETRQINGRKLDDDEKKRNPDIIHPLVRSHPMNGRKAFFLSTGAIQRIFGMPDEEGRALVQELAAYVTRDAFVYTHHWKPGDLLLWDDRMTLHRASLYDDDKYERLVYRIWVRGERPR